MTVSTQAPLAERMRPSSLDGFFGQAHLLAPGKPLRQAIESGQLHSMIFWGPPGSGKTTLARLVSGVSGAHFHSLSAVLAGVKDIRDAVALAKRIREQERRPTLLFIDEVHRFNKAQQDAFLPHVEDGTLTFIGATTENPSFALNNALLSRARVYLLRALEPADLAQVLRRALADPLQGFGRRGLRLGEDALERLAQAADGDARRALNLLELAVQMTSGEEITSASITEVMAGSLRRFDRGGDLFYDQISALHKAVRGSAPDAALYWLARMIDGGCDPLYIARRVVRMASEDIGNADPRALDLALAAWQVQERLGSPEGELALAQAVVYLASAAKSNAVYLAWDAALADVRATGSLEVPVHLRNAPTKLLEELGHGRAYRYPHDEPEAYAAGETYLPPALQGRRYYHPVERGLEIRIREKLQRLAALDAAVKG
ncbi:MAG: replication-associated recombination protein A [Sphingobacteriia bacterium]|nr:replication-associated recombination protein A [Sphingobacteriia bacterium]NCC39304.1 replication-associated recombination protein A [Gammaproteobacteria bacterium]